MKMKATDLSLEQENAAADIVVAADNAASSVAVLFKSIVHGVDELGLTEEYAVEMVCAAKKDGKQRWAQKTAENYVANALREHDPAKYRKRSEGEQGRPVNVEGVLVAHALCGGEFPTIAWAGLDAKGKKNAANSAARYVLVVNGELVIRAATLAKFNKQNPDIAIG